MFSYHLKNVKKNNTVICLLYNISKLFCFFIQILDILKWYVAIFKTYYQHNVDMLKMVSNKVSIQYFWKLVRNILNSLKNVLWKRLSMFKQPHNRVSKMQICFCHVITKYV